MAADNPTGDDPPRLPAPGKRQRQAEATREQLSQAALDLFETRGYQSTTVGSITERANTAHGTFYLYFKNKQDVFEHVVSEVVDELYATAMGMPTENPSYDVETSISTFFRVVLEHPGLWRCMLEAMLQNATIERWWFDLRRTFMDGPVAVLRSLQADGQMREVDPELAGQALGSMIEWFAFVHFVFREPEPGPDAIDAATAVVRDLWNHAVFGQLTS